MTLYAATTDAFSWLFGLSGRLIGPRPGRMSAIILAAALQRALSLVLFFLPIKVILLAASDGVPRYFSPFIAPDMKEPWIVGLALATIAMYLLSNLLDYGAARLARGTALRLLRESNTIRLMPDDERAAIATFDQLIALLAALLFLTLALLAIALLHQTVFLLTLAVVILVYVCCALVLARGRPPRLPPIIREEPQRVARFTATAGFLCAFFALLVPYLFGGGGNLLIAILTVLILRQAGSAGVAVVQGMVKLSVGRGRVEALLCGGRLPTDRADRPDLDPAHLCSPEARAALTRQLSEAGLLPTPDIPLQWADYGAPGIITLAQPTDDGKAVWSLCQCLPRALLPRLDNERYLRACLNDPRLHFPPERGQLQLGELSLRVIDCGAARPLRPADWPQARRALLLDAWCVTPTDQVLQAASQAQPSLGEQLAGLDLGRLAAGVDSNKEDAALQWFADRQAALAAWLDALPGYIHNDDANPQTVLRADDGGLIVTAFGRWRVLPMGAVWAGPLSHDTAAGALADSRAAGRRLADAITPETLIASGRCYTLVQACQLRHFKQAIKTLSALASSSVLPQ